MPLHCYLISFVRYIIPLFYLSARQRFRGNHFVNAQTFHFLQKTARIAHEDLQERHLSYAHLLNNMKINVISDYINMLKCREGQEGRANTAARRERYQTLVSIQFG